MKVSELLKDLKEVPEDAVVYIESDHGQSSEQAGGVYYTTRTGIDNKLPYYGDDFDWCERGDVEDISCVTAVLIG